VAHPQHIRPQTRAPAMAFSSAWPTAVSTRRPPLGINGLETGLGFHNQPAANSEGNYAMLLQEGLQQNTSALDALCAHFSLSVLRNTRFRSDLWKTMALSIFLWDLPTLFRLRTVAKRLTFITWQYCSICRHFRMAGPHYLAKPTIGPFEPTPPGFAHYLAANETCACCRAEHQRTSQHDAPPHSFTPPAATPWRPTPRCTQCNRQRHGGLRQLHAHELGCTGAGYDFAITGDSD
jgi:hypothetical protein